MTKLWSAFGLNSQAFPLYYGMGPVRFIDSKGEDTGKKGSVARLSRSLSNAPHMFMGIRVRSVLNFPPQRRADDIEVPVLVPPRQEDVELYKSASECLQNDQTVRINLSQQNISADAVLQTTICGTETHWHPFPAPFPMAGGNEIEVEIVRMSDYPSYSDGTPIIPEVYVTLLAAVLRTDMSNQPVVRRAP